jgi:hypothetical protein
VTVQPNNMLEILSPEPGTWKIINKLLAEML